MPVIPTTSAPPPLITASLRCIIGQMDFTSDRSSLLEKVAKTLFFPNKVNLITGKYGGDNEKAVIVGEIETPNEPSKRLKTNSGGKTATRALVRTGAPPNSAMTIDQAGY